MERRGILKFLNVYLELQFPCHFYEYYMNYFLRFTFQCYEVRVDISQRSLMRMERAATCKCYFTRCDCKLNDHNQDLKNIPYLGLFGIRQFGVDINGYVHHPELGMCLWMQRRAKTKSRWGGKLDNVVRFEIMYSNPLIDYGNVLLISKVNFRLVVDCQ